MPLLEYKKWEIFNNVIKKAVIAYRNSNNDDSYWLPEIRKPIITGKGKEEFIIDFKLSRYICYLIVQNANPKKKKIALGQTYFAIQTRKQELNEKRDRVDNEYTANPIHYDVGKEVRNSIKRLGGTMSEDLPEPDRRNKEN